MNDIREIRRIYSIYDALGLDIRKNKIICPLPQHVHSQNTPSFHIFTKDGVELFKCFGTCGLYGDVIDLVGYMNFPNYSPHDPEDISLAIALLGQKVSWREPVVERPAVLLPDAWREYLPPGSSAVAYAHRRGLNDETIVKFKLGSFENWLSIPYFEEGSLKGIKFRNTRPGLRFMMAKGSRAGLFNYDRVAYTEFPLLFVKGEIPTMLLDQLGFLACGLTTGESSNIEHWLPVLSFSKLVVVVGDNDPDPKTMRETSAHAHHRADLLHGVLRFPPEGFKDIDQWCLADPGAVHIIWSWLQGE